MLSVLLRYTDSDYPFGIFKLVLGTVLSAGMLCVMLWSVIYIYYLFIYIVCIFQCSSSSNLFMGYLWLLIMNVYLSGMNISSKNRRIFFLDKLEMFIYLWGLLIYYKKTFNAYNLHILQCLFSWLDSCIFTSSNINCAWNITTADEVIVSVIYMDVEMNTPSTCYDYVTIGGKHIKYICSP